MVAQWLAHLPLVLNVLSLNMGSGHWCWNFDVQTCSINVICKDDIKKCVDLWLQIGTEGLFYCVCVVGVGGWFPCSG